MIGWLRTDWGKYCSILVIWVVCYFLPIFLMETTELYGDHFHVFQSIVPLFLIYAVYHLSPLPHQWGENLSFVFILQILHNLGDVLFDDAWQAYDSRQSILNGIELALLIGWGLPVMIYQTFKAYRMSRDSRPSHHSPDSRRRLAKNSEGLPGHVR